MNKQTSHIDREQVAQKSAQGMAISKKELSVYLGVNYHKVVSWKWLPTIGNRLFYEDYVIARRVHLGLASPAPISASKRK